MRLTKLQKILWTLVVISSVILISLFVLQKPPSSEIILHTAPAFTADFELTDHQGKIQTDEDFASKWLLVFFGFTNCPDICPTTLAEISVVMNELGQNADLVQPLFITVDPKRDTPEVLAQFIPLFHPSIIGLTGTPEQIELTGKSFKIYFEKLKDAASPDGYTMGHSSQLLLFNPKGGYERSFAYGTKAEVILADLNNRF